MKVAIKYLAVALLTCMMTATISSCDKSTEHEIRQKWKFEKYIFANGTEMQVDSVFLNFMKGSATAIFACGTTPYYTIYGAYRLMGDSIEIEFTRETDEEKNKEYFYKYFNWTSFKNQFRIKTLTSGTLELERNDTTMLMTKY